MKPLLAATIFVVTTFKAFAPPPLVTGDVPTAVILSILLSLILRGHSAQSPGLRLTKLRERLPIRQGARASFFSPDLSQLYLALPEHNGQNAEIRIYQAN